MIIHSVLGEEARQRGKQIMLGPSVNIQRTPLCGPNFEYMGEDPFLSARMGLAFIRGLQSQQVAACVKHLATNNQEWDRLTINVEVDAWLGQVPAVLQAWYPGMEGGTVVQDPKEGCFLLQPSSSKDLARSDPVFIPRFSFLPPPNRCANSSDGRQCIF